MNIIAGKQYVTACGLITPPLKRLRDFDDMFDIGFGNPMLWRKDGTFLDSKDGNPWLNIIKEHVQPFQCTYMSGDSVSYLRNIDEECSIVVDYSMGYWITSLLFRGPLASKWCEKHIQGDFREELADIKKEELNAWYERKTRAGKNSDHEQHSEPAGAGDVAG